MGQRTAPLQTTLYILVLLLFLSLLSQNALGLGLAPSRKVLNYEDTDITIESVIINDQGRTMKVVAVPQGDLAKHVKIVNNLIQINASEPEKQFTYTLQLKNASLTPGANLFKVAFIEIPPEFKSNFIISENQIISLDSNEKATVSATTAIIQQVVVNIPYPESYVEGKLYVIGDTAGSPVKLSISLFNRGNTDTSVKGIVVIKGPTNEEIERIDLGYAKISPEEESRLVGEWSDTKNTGEYIAEAYLTYGEKSFTLTQAFTVGQPFVAIDALSIGSFRLGAIAKLDLDITSKWNKAIKDITGEMRILDEKGGVVDSLETTRKTLLPHGSATISGYWDTESITVGEYGVNVELAYEGRKTQKQFSTVVSIDSIQVKEGGAIGQVIGAKKGESNMSLLIILIIVLILLNIAILLFFGKMKGILRPPKPPERTRPPTPQQIPQNPPSSNRPHTGTIPERAQNPEVSQ